MTALDNWQIEVEAAPRSGFETLPSEQLDTFEVEEVCMSRPVIEDQGAGFPEPDPNGHSPDSKHILASALQVFGP